MNFGLMQLVLGGNTLMWGSKGYGNNFTVSHWYQTDLAIQSWVYKGMQSMWLCHAWAGACEITELSKAYWERGTSVAVSKVSPITSWLNSQSFSKYSFRIHRISGEGELAGLDPDFFIFFIFSCLGLHLVRFPALSVTPFFSWWPEEHAVQPATAVPRASHL